MRSVAVLFAFLLPAVLIPSAVAGDARWQVTPVVTKATPVPDSTAKFEEFGETYVSENFIAFWARTGPSQDKDWALFSWKDGGLTRVAVHDQQFSTPDSRLVRLMHTPKFFHGGISRLEAGRRFLYFSAGSPAHIYGWDGDKWQRVLGDGDTLDVNGVPHAIHRAHVLDIDAEGRVLVYWDSSKPKANGWALYDGSTWTPVFKEGDALPGVAGVTIKNLTAGLICLGNCVPEPKLFPGGGVAAILSVAGAPYKTALFRIQGGKAEKLLAEGEPVTIGKKPEKARLGKILAANSTSLAMYFPEVTVTTSTTPTSITWTTRTRERIFVLHDGKQRFVEEFGMRELGAVGGGSGLLARVMGYVDLAEFPTPGSPGLLFTLRMARGKSGLATWMLSSFPGLYYWDGEKTTSIEWEKSAGVTTEAAIKQLQRKVSRMWNPMQSFGIGLTVLPPQAGGVRVDLPPVEAASRVWLFPSGGGEPKLATAPRTEAGGFRVSDTDILTGKANGEVIAKSDDGLFLLRAQ